VTEVEHVASGPTIEHLRRSRTVEIDPQRVVPGAAVDVVDPDVDDAVCAGAAADGVSMPGPRLKRTQGSQVDAIVPVPAPCLVVTVAKVHVVSSQASAEAIVAGLPSDQIAKGPAGDLISPWPTEDHVITAATTHNVVSATSADHVIAPEPDDHVRSRSAGELVGRLGANDVGDTPVARRTYLGRCCR
jgi:hypothetical protein